ncbi:ExbD/TolR family protein [Haliscomenobacter hydrossis]|nr:biopolymer transporter ExbD [Haliscomenobacter hydrossis]
MAEFNVSSLTDIIFLLLIFFMLTSGVVSPNALNLQLPGNSSVPSNSSKRTDEVRIETDGHFFLNGRATSLLLLEEEMKFRNSNAPQPYTFVIAPDPGTPVEHVVTIMDMALRLNLNAILSSEGKKQVNTPGEFKFNR